MGGVEVLPADRVCAVCGHSEYVHRVMASNHAFVAGRAVA